jgi:hypothetical protein
VVPVLYNLKTVKVMMRDDEKKVESLGSNNMDTK